MDIILLWVYILLGICVSLKFISKNTKSINVDVPIILIIGAFLMCVWPIYLVYNYCDEK